ncbi:MAG: VCBS repeat-containing protein [Burkholderiales bacterium]|nr:VCBS repeat-containing protein [Bacteroidia bacterium]
MKKVLFSVCLILNFCLQGQVTPVCFNGSAYSAAPVTSNNSDITSGDFNGDGIEDLASSNFSSGNISVFIGAGNGNFMAPVNYTVGYGPKALKSVDFDNDGNIDLVFMNGNPSDIAILYGLGTGIFATVTQFNISVDVNRFEVADLNNDGNLDFVFGNTADTKMRVLLNNGIGGFLTGVDYILNNTANQIIIKDFNGDGNKDLALLANFAKELTVLFGSPTGTFTPTFLAPNSFPSPSLFPSTMTSGDFNNDGKQDIAISGYNWSNNNFVYVLISNNLNGFNAPTIVPINKTIAYIKAVDLNADNITDIIGVTGIATNVKEVTVLLGIGTGSFSVNNSFYTGVAPVNIETKDFNNDGVIDLALNNNGYISLLLGSGAGIFISNNFALEDAPIAATYNSIESADFNSDGINDLVVTNTHLSTVSVLLGLGAGQFSPAVNFTVGLYPKGVATGDFNGDSKIDLAVTNDNSADVSVLLGTGTGSFSSAVNYLGNSNPNAITVNDFNGDGYSDFAFVCSTGNSLFIRLGNASGTLPSGGAYSVGNFPISVNSGDFNGDGKMDLVTANKTTNSVSVLINNGTGSFLSAVNYTTSISGNSPTYVLTGDFNGDTKIDLGVACASSYISIFNGTGSGTFLSSVNYSVGAIPFSIIKDDYNNDGRIDLLVAHTNSTFFSILMSTPSGTFSPAINYPIGQTQGAICSTDLNGDGKKDIVIENRVFINSSPTLSLSAANSICLGNSTIINVSNLGISSYNWSTGATTSSISVTPTVNTIYSLTATTTGGCMSTAVKTISVSTITPTISISGTNTVCVNSSSTFTSTGASTYTWSNGAITTSVVFSPTTTTNYSVVGTNSLGCSSTETLSVIVDNTCADVWPGDANSDGTADNLDVLELGLHYTQIGAPRTSASNLWQSYFANNWTGTITNGNNLNHSDCNGDGTINDDDTLAIYNNYGLTHAFKTAQTTTVNPQLSIVPDQAMVVKGMWGTASVYLGDISNTITNINGIAFTVDFDNTLIESNSIYLEYQNSFLDASQNLYFRKLDFAGGKIFTASTHTVSNNVSGYGKIATLHYQILSSLSTDQTLTLGVTQANQSDASGVITSLTTGTGTLMALGASVGVKESLMSNNILISPNPTNGILNISFTSIPQNTKIEIYNSIGALVLSETMSSKNNTIHISDLSSGMYFIKVIENGKAVTVQKVMKE